MQKTVKSDRDSMTMTRRQVVTGAAALGASTLICFKNVVAPFYEATMAL